MKIFYITLCASVMFFGTPLSAHAQENKSPYKGGMQYTTLGGSSARAAIEKKVADETKAVKERSLSIAKPAKSIQNEDEVTGSASKVWEKYKDLAQGKADPENEGSTAQEDTKTEDEKETTAEAEAPAPQTGFAAILNQYQQRKSKQGQMNTINVPRPKLPKKPSAQ